MFLYYRVLYRRNNSITNLEPVPEIDHCEIFSTIENLDQSSVRELSENPLSAISRSSMQPRFQTSSITANDRYNSRG